MDGIRGHAICSKGKPALVKSSSFPTAATRSDPFADHEMTVMAKKTPKGQLDITGSLRRNPPPQPKKPPKAGAFRRRPNSAQSTFRTFYDQGHIPIMQCDTVGGCKMKWAESVPDCALLDYHHYLPLFFDGLRETTHPYEMMAEEGVRELLEHGHGKVLSVVPQLILPIKNALETHDKRVVCRTLLAIQRLCVSADMVGEALVPYYRQILPVLNKFKNKNCNLGDQIDYGQQKKDNIGDLIEETLCTLEKHGGQDAYINIKYMIPTYESCIQN